MNTLRDPDKNLSDAVEARQELDLRIGASFTRFQTLLLQKGYSIKGVVSYGPCQFPTLGFVVERHRNIENFIAERFWYVAYKHKWYWYS
jgi:DNA topoisomerase-3